MNSDMLLLAKRLVIAMETMSQDIKCMSTYVHDLSCSVSYLLDERKQKENVSGVAHDETDYPPSSSSAPGEAASMEREYSGQCEQANEKSSSLIGEAEHEQSFFRDIPSMNIDHNLNRNVLSALTEGMKMEEQSEDEVNDTNTVYRNSRKSARAWEDVKSEADAVNDRQDETHIMHTTTSNLPERSTPSHLLETRELASTQVQKEVDNIETSNNSAVESENVTYVILTSRGHSKAQEMEAIKDAPVMHTRVDLAERPHKCSLCEKSFKFRTDLQRHIRVHTGERPYECNVCGKAFTLRSYLTTHTRLHTGQKPYDCSECGKVFSRKQHLTRHKWTHREEKPYKCTLCGKGYSENQILKEHILIHTGEEQYICALCGKAYRYRSSFAYHIRTHSSEHPLQ